MNNIRIPSILLLKVTDILISDFTVETEFYNLCFAAQCTPIDNSSKFKFKIYEENIYLTVKNLNPNKAHIWNNVSIRMMQ